MTQGSSPPVPSNKVPAVEGAGPKLPAKSATDRGIGSRWQQVWSALQLIVSLALTVAMLVYLVVTPAAPTPVEDSSRTAKTEAVELAGPGLVRIHPGTSLETKLQTHKVESTVINSPILTVTGTVVASLRPGNENRSDFWQFSAPDVLTAYSDWQKATADIAFTEKQLERTNELANARIGSQRKVVDRLKKLVNAGTDTPKDLAAEETRLLEFQLQGQKEIYEAQTAVRLAKRSEAVLARQVQQAGLEPEMLRAATSDTDIVMADVPEGASGGVRVGEGCEATFFGLPDQIFTGKVDRIAPVLSAERRTLRILFIIHDPHDLLRPGMFAEIGLGTDDREALLIPADGVIHIGRSDYALVATGETNAWRITEVHVGEPHDAQVEVHSGIASGDTIIGKGAILLKPAAVNALRASKGESAAPPTRLAAEPGK